MKFLLPFSWLYACAMLLRNKLFDWGVLKTEDVGIPVISVGNLTMGGTGKTPLVEYIVGQLLSKKKRVAAVSRGYKRKSRGVVVVADGTRLFVDAERGGDEPIQIAAKFPAAVVVVGEKRVEAAQKAVALGAEVVVLDDGFQHRHLKRNLDIVVIDATDDITRDNVLPAGRMREPLVGLRRADLVAFSRADKTVLSQSKLEKKLGAVFSAPAITYRYFVSEVRRVDDSEAAARTMNMFAFSGIGKHGAFVELLRDGGFSLVGDLRFSDHHAYSENDLQTLVSLAKKAKADACITTEKDAVRLRSKPNLVKQLADEIAVVYATIEIEFLGGKETLHSLLENCLQGKTT